MPWYTGVSHLHASVRAVSSALLPREDSVPHSGCFIKTHLHVPLHLKLSRSLPGLVACGLLPRALRTPPSDCDSPGLQTHPLAHVSSSRQ